MLIDVGEPGRNLFLNACFLVIALCGIVELLPWGLLGANRLSRVLRWLAVPCPAIAIVYELAMPAGYDIRVDLILRAPIYVVVLSTSAFRWVVWHRLDRHAGDAVQWLREEGCSFEMHRVGGLRTRPPRSPAPL